MTQEPDDERTSGNKRESLDQDLLTRFLILESLSLEELGQLSNQLFGGDKYVAKHIDAMLDEPPDSMGIVAPQLLFRVLEAQRKYINSRTNRSNADVALEGEVLERMAICVCVDDSLPRENRLKRALTLFVDAIQAGSVSRPITQRGIAAIVLRLVSEFKFAEHERFDSWNRFACRALQSAAPHASTPEERLGLHCDFCQLKLLDLKRQILTSKDSDQAKEAWKQNFLQAVASFEPIEGKESDEDNVKFERMVHAVLNLTMVSQDSSAIQQVAQFESSAYTFEGRHRISPELIAKLFAAMLMVARNRAQSGWPLPEGIEVLLPVLRLRHRRQMDAEKTQHQLHRFEGGGDFAEVIKEKGIETEIDDALLQRHILRLLEFADDSRRGLALSGGGFRATCFHVGVLAHLAESDELGGLDTISCVSGGSIAGAAYAVRLKALLAQKFDVDICRDDYIDAVKDLINAVTTLAGTNLRMRALASPKAVLKMWLYPGFTFAERIAELLDRVLFLPLARKHPSFIDVTEKQLLDQINQSDSMTKPGTIGHFKALLGKAPIGWPLAPWDLRGAPRCEPLDFGADRKYNASRNAKCPQTVFNATSVNSGASFVFAPEAHGERPWPYARQISSRPRFPWMSYDEISAGAIFAPDRMKLSRIVAASASVPGLIPPILLRRVHEDALHVLADGGIVDNQGVHHLIDAACDHIFVSDASGQLGYQAYPDVSSFSMMSRANDIMMERMRELGYKELLESSTSKRVISTTHVHLTSELSEPPPVSTFRPDNAMRRNMSEVLEEVPTSFGVVRSYQGAMARLRTDLDCFCKQEVYSLMLDGYLQARAAFPSNVTSPNETDESPEWPFMIVEDALKTYSPTGRLSVILEVGSNRFLRLPRLLWRNFTATPVGRIHGLSGCLTIAGVGVLLAVLVEIARTIEALVAGPLLIVLVAGFAVLRMQTSVFKRMLTKILSGPFLLVAMVYAWVVLLIGDPFYRRLGDVRRK